MEIKLFIERQDIVVSFLGHWISEDLKVCILNQLSKFFESSNNNEIKAFNNLILIYTIEFIYESSNGKYNLVDT